MEGPGPGPEYVRTVTRPCALVKTKRPRIVTPSTAREVSLPFLLFEFPIFLK